jgi:hypothetical protein
MPGSIEAGGTIISRPFDMHIGKCAAVRDNRENEYVIPDMPKGRYVA